MGKRVSLLFCWCHGVGGSLRRMGRTSHYHWSEVEVKAPYVVSPLTTVEKVVGNESLASYWVFSDILWQGVGGPHYSLDGWRSRLPTGLCLQEWGGPQISLSCLTVILQFLFESFMSCKTTLFPVLWLVGVGIYWGFFVLCLLMFLNCWLLEYMVWDIWSKKKSRGTHHRDVHWVPRTLAGLIFFSPFFSLLFLLYT